MIRHYLTFAHEARLLHRHLAGGEIDGFWMQEKDRAVLSVKGVDQFQGVELSVDLRFGYALPLREIHPPKKNRIDLMPSIVGRTILEVDVDPEERALRIALSKGGELVVPFYGPGGGNLLRLRKGELVESLRSVEGAYDSILLRREVEEVEKGVDDMPGDLSLLKGTMRIDRRLGPRLVKEGIFRLGLDPNRLVEDATNEERTALLRTVRELYDQAAESREYTLYLREGEVVFSLIRLQSLEESGEYERTDMADLPEAIRHARALYFRTERHRILRGRLLSTLKKEISKLERGLAHASDTEGHLARGQAWEDEANLILANLHQIKRGEDRATLSDWEGNERTVKLDRKLTPAENADRYFRKARGSRMEAERGAKRAEEIAPRLEKLREKYRRAEELDTIEQTEELERLAVGVVKNDADRSKQKGKQGEEREDRFRRFVVDGGVEVYVGKNAKNNDELTGRFARPNDVWLHARGTSGSHVVMRWNNPGENPPRRSLEESAMIAAYYSGARGSGLVPVAWTRKKYVRKPKGAAVGAVVMTREEVVMVEPKLPRSVTGG